MSSVIRYLQFLNTSIPHTKPQRTQSGKAVIFCFLNFSVYLWRSVAKNSFRLSSFNLYYVFLPVILAFLRCIISLSVSSVLFAPLCEEPFFHYKSLFTNRKSQIVIRKSFNLPCSIFDILFTFLSSAFSASQR